MSLKDNIVSDIDDIFFDIDEIASTHILQVGKNSTPKEVICVIDDDRIQERADKAAEGTYIGEYLLFIKASDLDGKPAPGAYIFLDNKMLGKVVWCVENFGIYELRVGGDHV